MVIKIIKGDLHHAAEQAHRNEDRAIQYAVNKLIKHIEDKSKNCKCRECGCKRGAAK